jgi:hypothetical protein
MLRVPVVWTEDCLLLARGVLAERLRAVQRLGVLAGLGGVLLLSS